MTSEPGQSQPNADPGRIEAAFHGELIAILDRLGLSLALSTRPNHIVFLGAQDGQPTLHATPIAQPMGLAATPERIAIATSRTITVFANVARLAAHHPRRPGYFDAYFVPRMMHFTGECLMHDMVFAGNTIVAANTNFSCLCRIDGSFSFTPFWQPPFITKLRAEDRCHLNGFAAQAGKPRYVTALSSSDVERGWRDLPDGGGVLIDTDANKMLRDDLCMPHSPRLVGEDLYVLNGGEGEVLRVDRATGAHSVLASLPGFTHGLYENSGILFVGLSQNRVSRKANPPPVARRVPTMIAAVVAVEAKTGDIRGMAEFTSGVTEIYDVQGLPNIRRAGMQNLVDDGGFVSVDTPNSAFWLRRDGKESSRIADALASGNYSARVLEQ